MRIVTEQFLDRLRRTGVPIESVVSAGPLPDVMVVIHGAAIWRQSFQVSFGDRQRATYRVDPDGLTVLSGPVFHWEAARTG